MSLEGRSLDVLFRSLHVFARLATLRGMRLGGGLAKCGGGGRVLTFFRGLKLSSGLGMGTNGLSFKRRRQITFVQTLYRPFSFLFLSRPVDRLSSSGDHVVKRLVVNRTRGRRTKMVTASVKGRVRLPCRHVLRL